MKSGLRRKLTLALGVPFALLLLVTAASLTMMNHIVNDSLRSALAEARVSALANEVAQRALSCRKHEKDFLLHSEDSIERGRILHSFYVTSRELEVAIDAFSDATTSEEDRRNVEIWRAALRFYREGFEQTVDAVEDGSARSTLAALRMFQPVGENITSLTDLAVTASERKSRSAEEAGSALERLSRQVVFWLGALGALALVFAGVWSLLFPRQLLQPIFALREAAVRLGRGDLTARVEASSSDELGELAKRFNQMAETTQQRSLELEAQFERAEAARKDAEAANKHIAEQLQTIRAQQAMIRDMSVPILPLTDSTMLVPLVGELDSERLALAQERALLALQRSAARYLILDITAVPIVDTAVANGLVRLVRATELLGAQTVLVGIRPDVATSLVQLGVELGRVRTLRTLQSGIAYTTARAQSGAR
jgi:anti-anti-sigma regulatory factor/HAMP domain-containing protein